ncbi:MAG: M20 family metallopeptidase [Dehalococcoidia bacterium]
MDEAVAAKVLSRIDRDSGAMLDLLARLVKIPSFKNEETPVARFLASYLRRRGYQVELQEVEPGRFQTIATLKGAGGGKSLMFNGHIDIDELARGWKRDPWTPTIEGDRMYGAGTFNMKGGVAAMIAAAEAIRKTRVPLRGDIVLACVVGELAGGEGTVHMLEQGVRTDAAIVTEPFGADAVGTVHTGIVHMAIHTYGHSKHLSDLTGAVDAIEKMEKVTKALRSTKMTYTPRADLPAMPKLQVGGIIGGRGPEYDLVDPYLISDFCTVIVDVHFVHSQTVDSILADIRRTLEPLVTEDPDLKYEIEIPVPRSFKSSRWLVMDPFDIPTDHPFVQTVVKHYAQVVGSPPRNVGAVIPLSYSGDDTCHLWKRGIPCVLYGPGGVYAGEEEPDNYVLISEMVRSAKVLAHTALEFCA